MLAATSCDSAFDAVLAEKGVQLNQKYVAEMPDEYQEDIKKFTAASTAP